MGDQNCCLREQIKYSLYTKLKEPKLYRFAAKGDWDLIPQRCLTHPKEAKFVHRYPPSDTALSRLLRFPRLDDLDCETANEMQLQKVDAIRALLQSNRNSASTTDSSGRMPLHLACMDVCNCGEVAAMLILDAWPQAGSHQDLEGRTPIHYLVGRNDDIPLPFLEKMMHLNPGALDLRDSVGETPLDVVRARGTDEIVNYDAIVQALSKSGAVAPVASP